MCGCVCVNFWPHVQYVKYVFVSVYQKHNYHEFVCVCGCAHLRLSVCVCVCVCVCVRAFIRARESGGKGSNVNQISSVTANSNS